MTNSAFAANERRWLEEDPDECDVLSCPNDAEPGSILCARHEDEVYDYRNGDSND
jgi:hypothetical protein